MTDAGPPPPRRWRRRLIVICRVFGIAGAIVAMSPARRPPPIKMPDPNGYEDLARAGAMIHGDWPNKGDFAKAKLDEVRAFLESNRSSLDLARVGLGRECLSPFENSHAGLGKHMKDFGQIRGVARLLTGEGIVRQADGQTVEAVRSYRDVLALGQAMAQGGVLLDLSGMVAVQTSAINRLRALHDKLPSGAIIELLRDLESLDRRRVPLDAILAREDLWYQGAFNSYERTLMRLSGVEKGGREKQLKMAKDSLNRAERDMRFFMIELAIVAYHEDKTTWPRSVKDLVPTYLASVPIDPSTGQTIDYPTNPSGELTDDLTTIARPDGEVTPHP